MKLYRIILNYERYFYIEAIDQVDALKKFIEDRRSIKDDAAEYHAVSIEYLGSVIR